MNEKNQDERASRQPKDLSPAARRALAEAAERRAKADARPSPPKELGGPKGPEPVRYGDWEIKGRVSDF
jgi:hypothetical protein